MEKFSDFPTLAQAVYLNAVAKGFRVEGTAIDNRIYTNNLCGEIIELWEAYRLNMLDAPCNKDTKPHGRQITCREEELADIIIRSLDILVAKNFKVNPVQPWGSESTMRDHNAVIHRMLELTMSFSSSLSAPPLEDLLALCAKYAEVHKVDLWEVLNIKHAYNCNRSFRHGGKVC